MTLEKWAELLLKGKHISYLPLQKVMLLKDHSPILKAGAHAVVLDQLIGEMLHVLARDEEGFVSTYFLHVTAVTKLSIDQG